jgi:hypothetical protein
MRSDGCLQIASHASTRVSHSQQGFRHLMPRSSATHQQFGNHLAPFSMTRILNLLRNLRLHTTEISADIQRWPSSYSSKLATRYSSAAYRRSVSSQCMLIFRSISRNGTAADWLSCLGPHVKATHIHCSPSVEPLYSLLINKSVVTWTSGKYSDRPWYKVLGVRLQ